MKLYNFYDKKNLIDKTWYDSSTIYYSECYDKIDELKEVKVVFKNGTSYLYKNVNVTDYLKFRESSSQGKAIIQYLAKKKDNKPIYEYQKLENIDISILEEERKILENKTNEEDSPTITYNPQTQNLNVVNKENIFSANKINGSQLSIILRILETLNVKVNINYIENKE